MSNKGWLNWAMQNATPERVQSALGWAKQNVDTSKLEALKSSGEEMLKSGVGKEIRDAIAEEQSSSSAPAAKGWGSWLKSNSSGTLTPLPATQTTRQKYIRLAVKNWKMALPVGIWLFGMLMSWIWVFVVIGAIYYFVKKRKAKSA